MPTNKKSTRTAPKKSPTQKKTLNSKKNFFSWKYAAIFIALAVAVGGYIIYSSYASAWPKNALFTPGARTSNRLVQAAICQSGQNRIWVTFTKSDRSKLTDYAPELVFARNGVRTGQITGYKTWRPLTDDPSADQYLGNQTMGNRKADDTVKVKYGGAQGAAIRWRQVPYCRY